MVISKAFLSNMTVCTLSAISLDVGRVVRFLSMQLRLYFPFTQLHSQGGGHEQVMGSTCTSRRERKVDQEMELETFMFTKLQLNKQINRSETTFI